MARCADWPAKRSAAGQPAALLRQLSGSPRFEPLHSPQVRYHAACGLPATDGDNS
ncbi:hypothetical protein [Pantoea sp. C2G6]|uniref:hypothetical protein n=1 Tax=Pantoea sp. C2G6 TaxID=3243084 RepID=UPI003ED93B24